MIWDTGKILSCIFSACFAVGALDYFRNNQWHLGEYFIAGIRAFEPLFLTMAGILVLVPFFNKAAAPFLAPFFSGIGIDPSVISGLFLANDMGGYQLAHSLSDDRIAANFSGMLLGSVFGVNLVFTLPAALKMIRPEDRHYLFSGLLFGFITVPVGCFAGGLVLGCPVGTLLKMMIPVAFIAFLSAALLLLIPGKLSKLFSKIGRTVEGIALLGISAAVICETLGVVKSDLLGSISASFDVVDSIVMILPGTYVLIRIINLLCHPFFLRLGRQLGINEAAVVGLFTSLANSIPTFEVIQNMDPKGKLLNFAFLTAGAFTLGDHLAFCCAVAPELVIPLLATKLTAAFSAVLLVLLFLRPGLNFTLLRKALLPIRAGEK